MDPLLASPHNNPVDSTDLGRAFFLGGDSLDTHVEATLQSKIGPVVAEWIGQQDLLRKTGQTKFDRGIDQRVQLLTHIVKPRDVLMGRSSGARVATIFALDNPVSAVICFGYPFRVPGRVLEPDRFAHLAYLNTPTLIIQGLKDAYGNATITESYALSASVSVILVDCNHNYQLSPEQWDVVAGEILSFCQAVSTGSPPDVMRFDEVYYLNAYPDVAAAVEKKQFVSGLQHFERHGRAERRRFRVLQ